MTFCIGLKCEQGLVAIADTRLTSGSVVSTGKKISVHQNGDHAMCILTSGLRSVRDKAIIYFEERLRSEEPALDRMYKAANLLAEEIRRVYVEDEEWLRRSGLIFDLHCILGGQMSADETHHLYMIYPQGNWVELSSSSSYVVIGESAYGKPVLDRAWRHDGSLERALRLGLLAFDATRTSASDVGPPVDAVLYRTGSFTMQEHRFTADDLAPVAAYWREAIVAAVELAIPSVAPLALALGASPAEPLIGRTPPAQSQVFQQQLQQQEAQHQQQQRQIQQRHWQELQRQQEG